MGEDADVLPAGLRPAAAHQIRAGLLTDGTRRPGSGVGESGVDVGVQASEVVELDGAGGMGGGERRKRVGNGERVV